MPKKPVLTMKQAMKIKRWNKMNDVDHTWDKLDAMGIFHDGFIRLGPYDCIKDAWKNEPAFIIGSSRGAEGFDLTKLNGYHSIGINHIIEDYDLFEWFIFLDQRFLNTTTYNIDNYKGRIFASNKTFLSGSNVTRFRVKSGRDKPDLNIETGLFNGYLTGIAALNLALITGANPIYLIGMDTGKSTVENYHYKNDYPGEINTAEKLNKYKFTMPYFEKFNQWSDRIINCDPDGIIKSFDKIHFSEIPFNKLEKYKNNNIKKYQEIKNPVICHVAAMDNINVMGDISRYIYNETIGDHIFYNINSDKKPPKADIYFLECFINSSEKFRAFKKPHEKAKIISLIHSSGKCMPSVDSDRIVSITNAWKDKLKLQGYRSDMIHAGIDLKPYLKNGLPDYRKKTFGRITRNSPGKVNKKWPDIVRSALNKYDDSTGYFITDKPRATEFIKHDRFNYITDIKINEHDRKAEALQKCAIYADAHGPFIETFSLGLLEGMAAGCACIIISQPAMNEVLGDAGIICRDEKEFEIRFNELLFDFALREKFGKAARKRAELFSIEKMVNSYNQLFKEVLR